MKNYLLNLYKFLKSAGHEEADELAEFYSDPISEDEYFKENFEESPETKDSKYAQNYNVADLLEISKESLNNILDKYKIRITSTKGKTPRVGAGASASVYDCIYEGKPAVVKLSREADAVQVWEKILSLKIPEQYASCIPKIYLLATENLASSKSPYKNVEISIIVMEKLKPLPSWLYNQRLQQHPQKQNYQAALNLAKNITKSVIQSISEPKFNHLLYVLEETKNNIIANENHYSLLVYDFLIKHYLNNHIAPDRYETANIILMQIFKLPKDFELAYPIRILIQKYLDIHENKSYFHSNYFDFSQKHNQRETKNLVHNPEFRRISAFMHFLAQHKIYFCDLHSANLMIDQDGNIKIIDTENFDIK